MADWTSYFKKIAYIRFLSVEYISHHSFILKPQICNITLIDIAVEYNMKYFRRKQHEILATNKFATRKESSPPPKEKQSFTDWLTDWPTDWLNEWMNEVTSALQAIQCQQIYESLTKVIHLLKGQKIGCNYQKDKKMVIIKVVGIKWKCKC